MASKLKFVGEPLRTKRHNTAPLSDVIEIETPAGSGKFQPMDLSATTVRFNVADRDGVPLFSGDAETYLIEYPAGSGTLVEAGVRYTPTSQQMAFASVTDDAFPLKLPCEWRLTLPGGVIKTVPEGDEYRELLVGLDLVAT